MAKIVLGMVASHGPLLGTPPELWTGRVQADINNPALEFRGKQYNFTQLTELRAPENFGPQIELPVRQKRFDACQKAIAELERVFAEVKPDVVVMLGNDQQEIMGDDNQPAVMVYYGERLDNVPFSDEQKKLLGPGVELAEPNHHPKVAKTYPGHPALGLHLIEKMMEQNFDVAVSSVMPERKQSRLTGIPHAFGFYYQRIMGDNAPPCVPVFTNTFYPPNRPGGRRCYDMGVSLAKAIQDWDKDLRVAILGSGGMTHFVVDEKFDRDFLEAFADRDPTKLLAFPDNYYRSGNSELKNWIPTKSAMDSVGLKMTLVDYQPLYRSIAGTGSGMGFAYWR